MAERTVTMKGNPLHLEGEELKVGQAAPDVELVAVDLSAKKISDYRGKVLILSTVPSLDTSTCNVQTRRFNEEAAELGSDVAFFIAAAPAVCRGRGEKVVALESTSPLDFVVVCPAEGLSTAEVYRHCQPADEAVPITPLLEAMRAGDRAAIGRHLHNRLEPAAAGLSPRIEQLAAAMNDLDVLGHQMSGSGTSYFALCRNRRHARAVAGLLRNRSVGRVFVLRSMP